MMDCLFFHLIISYSSLLESLLSSLKLFISSFNFLFFISSTAVLAPNTLVPPLVSLWFDNKVLVVVSQPLSTISNDLVVVIVSTYHWFRHYHYHYQQYHNLMFSFLPFWSSSFSSRWTYHSSLRSSHHHQCHLYNECIVCITFPLEIGCELNAIDNIYIYIYKFSQM